MNVGTQGKIFKRPAELSHKGKYEHKYILILIARVRLDFVLSLFHHVPAILLICSFRMKKNRLKLKIKE